MATDSSIGLYQEMPIEPIDYDKLRRDLADATVEDRINAAMNYMQAHYANRQMASTRWQG